MNLNTLRIFNTLAAELSFSKTAHLLYISQPAVSIQIKKLEKELGFNLFERSGKNLYLTDNGEQLYEYTKKIFSIVEEMESRLITQASNAKGLIEIGASNSPGNYILPQILVEFKNMFPDVTTNLHIGHTHEIERLVTENRVDFAINGGDIHYGDKVHSEELLRDRIVFVTSQSSRLANRKDVKIDELSNEKFIAHEKTSMLYKLVEEIFDEQKVPVQIVMTLGHIDAIKKAVTLDLGISALPESTVKPDLENGLLKQFEIKDKSWFYSYYLVYHKERHQSPASKSLMELIRKRSGK